MGIRTKTNKKAPGRVVCDSRPGAEILPLRKTPELRSGGQAGRPTLLRTAAGAAAVAALITAAVAGHDGAAFGAERGIGRYGFERQRLLRIGLGGAECHGLASFRHRVLGAEELGAEPAKDVVHDRL